SASGWAARRIFRRRSTRHGQTRIALLVSDVRRARRAGASGASGCRNAAIIAQAGPAPGRTLVALPGVEAHLTTTPKQQATPPGTRVHTAPPEGARSCRLRLELANYSQTLSQLSVIPGRKAVRTLLLTARRARSTVNDSDQHAR